LTLIRGLGWLGEHGSALDGAAKAIHSIGDAIGYLLSKIPSVLSGWLHGQSGGGVAPSEQQLDEYGMPLPFSGTSLQPQSYVAPSDNKKTIVTTTTINVDGKQLASAVESNIADWFENSPNAPSSNGAAYPDMNGGFSGR
jgi:hypothetical protein